MAEGEIASLCVESNRYVRNRRKIKRKKKEQADKADDDKDQTEQEAPDVSGSQPDMVVPLWDDLSKKFDVDDPSPSAAPAAAGEESGGSLDPSVPVFLMIGSFGVSV